MRGLILIAFVVVAACSSDDSSSADAAPPTSDGRDNGAACGGLAGSRCDEDAFCDYAGHTCGTADAAGTCAKRPDTCLDIIEQVCGCDGTVYTNQCVAQKAGVDPSDTAACETPPDHKRCGYRFCTKTQECKTSGTGPDATYDCQTP